MTESHRGAGLALNSQSFLCSIQSTSMPELCMYYKYAQPIFPDYFDTWSILLNPHCALDKDAIAVSSWGTHKCQVGQAVHRIVQLLYTKITKRRLLAFLTMTMDFNVFPQKFVTFCCQLHPYYEFWVDRFFHKNVSYLSTWFYYLLRNLFSFQFKHLSFKNCCQDVDISPHFRFIQVASLDCAWV